MTDDADGRALVERLRAERDERRRLAELIHDGPVQLVVAITQMLDAAHHALEAGDIASGSPIVERALAVAREASVDLREIVSGIEPDALRELGLAAAIAELTERHTQRRGVAFDLDVAAANDLGEGAQSGLYQIVRDALDQAVRRGPPGNVVVSIVPSDGGVALTITDDGAQERRAAVLATLGERAAELNGTFSSDTNEAGTRISIRLPPSAARL
ncbi:MAG: histidine kinase [Thermoleophilia bacterium]|nr:histidine kinase [Thermoleophilia bacterium]